MFICPEKVTGYVKISHITYEMLLREHYNCALQRGRVLPRTWEKWGQLGEGDEAGPGPADKGQDKQFSSSEEGGNMEQEEEGKKSQA